MCSKHNTYFHKEISQAYITEVDLEDNYLPCARVEEETGVYYAAYSLAHSTLLCYRLLDMYTIICITT